MNSFPLFRQRPKPLIVHPRRLGAPQASPADLSIPLGGQRRTSVLDSGEDAQTDSASVGPSGAYTMHTVVLADDHAVVRQSLKRLLCQQADLHLVGESGNGLETLSLVKRLQPDLLVTDLMMPGMNGLEVTRRIRLSFPATRVVVISVNGDEPYVSGALRCGANAFVLKTSCGRHLVPAVRAVLAGERFVSPPLGESVS
jgi:CheY-like chemotaxis protein